MKKYFPLLSILLILIVSGCSNSTKNSLFENRLKCDSLKEQIKKDAIDKESNSAFIENNGEGNTWIYEELDDVFYSQQRQSCLYIIKMKYSKESPIDMHYSLYDYFTGTHVAQGSYGKKDEDDYRIKEFWQTVTELKEVENKE